MSTYTVQDTTMTALGDAIRKQKFGKGNIVETQEISLIQSESGYAFDSVSIPLNYSQYNKVIVEILEIIKVGGIEEGKVHLLFYGTTIDNILNRFDETSLYVAESEVYEFYTKENYELIHLVSYGDIKIRVTVIPTDKDYNEYKYTPAEIVEKIDGFLTIPDEALTITGNASYRFAYNGWNWFIEKYGDKITTDKLSDAEYMFSQTTELEEIPFKVNVYSYVNDTINFIFYNCKNLKSIKGFSINCGHSSTFSECENLRYLPDDIQMDSSFATSGGYRNFYSCSSLRKIPTSILKECRAPNASYISSYNSIYGDTFCNCYALDELIGISLDEGSETTSITSNIFSDRTFQNCNRLKEVQFELNEDGTVKTRNWKNQLINLSQYVGYGSNENNITTRFNSGITADKKVYDDATYQALKDDPDWYSLDINYSRYNHDSAVNTINSLPDCSSSGGTNTIKFTGNSGALTDGGAINTLTEEEIAVATAKAWTVSLV